MSDQYAEIGELHDLFMHEPWHRLAPTLRTAFGELGPDATIVDIGAGTGVGTMQLAAVTRAQIIAIEPSLTVLDGR